MARVPLAEQLDAALKAEGLSIDGVSVGLLDDKTTWRVDFSASRVTKAQRDKAKAVIEAFEPAPQERPTVFERIEDIEARMVRLEGR